MHSDMIYPDIKEVIVVFKTHLDIGFTGLAGDILNRYCTDFIPAAVDLAFRVNQGRRQFVWTVGSYLIHHYLNTAPETDRSRLEEAIRAGYVCWHGLACTTHTELMDGRLLDYNLSISARLDQRFGKTTIAAKMTDVPGHTIGMVPHLAGAGIRYLHLGVNASSRVPSVPELFRWRLGEDEVIVSYAADYGQPQLLPDGTALEFIHAHDNCAPPDPEELSDMYAQLQEKYPNADIHAGTLDEFARAVLKMSDSLPVVESEIGDTWIHGAASDPLKVSRYRRLLKLKEKWLDEGSLLPGSPSYECLMENLLLICEHTWGMDTKKYLLDFTHWDKASFAEARKKNHTSYEDFGTCNQHIFQAVLPDVESVRTVRGGACSSYALFESSHAEQRAYVEKAVSGLPEALRQEAVELFDFSWPEGEEGGAYRAGIPGQPINLGGFGLILGCHGELTGILNRKNNRLHRVSVGLLEYETFGGAEADDCYFLYGRDLDQNFHWAEPDFGKPGLRYHTEISHRHFLPFPEAVRLNRDSLTVELRFPEEACRDYGCPGRAAVVYRAERDGIGLELYWKDKDAVRSPEAIWFSFCLDAETPARWRMRKLGADLIPADVVKGGNRQLHGVSGLFYEGADGKYSLTSVDAPLVSIGGKKLYCPDETPADPAGGFHFLLCNNRWGTNFKQWFEEDMRFSFHIGYCSLADQ